MDRAWHSAWEEAAYSVRRCRPLLERGNTDACVQGDRCDYFGLQGSLINALEHMLINASYARAAHVLVRFAYPRIIVEDDGQGGITMAHFQRGATTRPGSAGLGLYLTRRFMLSLGGTIQVRNRDGAVIIFTLTERYFRRSEQGQRS